MIKRNRIYLCLAHMSDDAQEQKYIKKAFDDNWVVPMGPNVTEFEYMLEQFVGQDKKVAALASGTAAVHLALTALGVGQGDDVCTQSFTFCASAHPIKYLGATPVFIDSERDTWNMDPELLEQAIQDRKAMTGKYPKAIIPVSLYGMPYQVDRIMAVANKYGIPVVEDVAEGFGSRFDGRALGTFGRYGVLSFNGNKMITTSGGGALICNDMVDVDNVVYFATQARTGYPYYQHENLGYNYRLSNVCAGIGIGQMSVAQAHINHHKRIQKMYEQLLADVQGVKVHTQPSNGRFDSNFWLCTIMLDPKLHIKGQENVYKNLITNVVGGVAGVLRIPTVPVTDCQPNDNVEAMRVYLDECQIETRPVCKPMHRQPLYKDCPSYVNGVSDEIFKVGLCLPAGPCVSDDDVLYIVECINKAIIR